MFDGYIRDFAAWTPRAPAVLLPDRLVSYADFDADVDRIGVALAELGLRPETGVVSLRIGEPYLHRLVLVALARLGTASSPAEDDAADLKLIYPRPRASGARDDAVVLTREWVAAALAAPHRPLPRLDPRPDALVRVMLSSGTTRTPKRIAFTWQRLELATLTNIRVYAPGKRGVWVPLTGVDTLMGFSMGVAAWALGAAYASGVGAEMLPDIMERHPEGVTVVTPILLRSLLANLPHGFELKPGWRLQVGGSALPANLTAEAMRRITPDVWHGYGATESSRITAGPAAGLMDVPGAVGVVPASALVEIVDEAGQPLPDGESGELRVRSTRTADGYLGDEAATADRFRDGWYYTNDVARRLPDGRVVIEGRVDDRMNLGGRKFMPVVLEAPAMECPGVEDCAAFAVPGPLGLDQVWLAVVAAPDFDRASLSRHLAGRPHLPRLRLAWIDAIPRNEMGKVERTRLREAVLRTRSDHA